MFKAIDDTKLISGVHGIAVILFFLLSYLFYVREKITKQEIILNVQKIEE